MLYGLCKHIRTLLQIVQELTRYLSFGQLLKCLESPHDVVNHIAWVPSRAIYVH